MTLDSHVRLARTGFERFSFALPAIACVLLGSFLFFAQALTNSDVAWLLTGTAKWLDGARLYEDIIEINPPLIFAINAVPVLFARVTGVAAEILFVLYVHCLIAGSLFFSFKVLGAWPSHPRALAPATLFLSCVSLCAFAVYDLGQREHLLVVFTLPYMFLIVVRAAGGAVPVWLALCVGVFAGIGFGLKPYFLLVPAALEFYLMLRFIAWRTILRPESLSLAAVLVFYACAVVLLTPEYLTRIVPFALIAYGAYDHPWFHVFLSWQTLIVPALGIIHLRTRRRQVRPEFADVFLIAALALYVVYLVQRKIWSYHILPVESFSFLALFALAVADPVLRPRGRFRLAIGVCVVAAMLAIPVQRGPFRLPAAQALLPVVTAHAKGAPIYVLSSYLWVAFPMVNLAGAEWPSRFPCLWLLPGALHGLNAPEAGRDPALSARYAAMERYTIDAVVEDMTAGAPALIIVDRRPDPRFDGLDFNYVVYFSQDARFAAIWQEYRWVQSVEGEGVGPYDIYLRRDPFAAGAAS